MSIEFIPFAEGEARLNWLELADAIEAGHAMASADVADSFLYRANDTLLSRAAWIDGMGVAVKAATIFPGNAHSGAPTINGAVNLFSDEAGMLEAVIDFHLVTKWKTAGDSLLGALKLARPDSKRVLIVGAGTVARSLVEAYRAGFPDAVIGIWNRSADKAKTLADELRLSHETDLAAAISAADIISSATMSTDPVIKGEWLRPGQHLDLIGAYRPDMREADDTALKRARLFMDSRDTVLGHIGEFKIPLAAGTIQEDDVVADFTDLQTGRFARKSVEDITLFKNGGGAHLDLMTARYVLSKWRS